MRRIPWDIVLALLAGLGLGLVYSWLISPLRVVDADPVALRADFKDGYRAAIAAAYAATGNLPRRIRDRSFLELRWQDGQPGLGHAALRDQLADAFEVGQ